MLLNNADRAALEALAGKMAILKYGQLMLHPDTRLPDETFAIAQAGMVNQQFRNKREQDGSPLELVGSFESWLLSGRSDVVRDAYIDFQVRLQ